MNKRASQPTLITREGDERRRALLRSRLRSTAFRIGAECDRLQDELLQSKRHSWSEALGQIQLAARRLVALTAPGRQPVGDDRAIDDTIHPSARVVEIHATITGALAGILPAVPLGPDEDLIIRGLHDLQDLAAALLDDATGPSRSGHVVRRRTPPRGSGIPHHHRVLIVDDEPLVLELLRRLLTDMGHEVVQAEHGRAALKVAAAGGIDLILTDIEMPELDGVALLTHLKKDEATREIPVIVVSSQSDLASVVQCIELGAEDHIGKPFERLLLRARVSASLDRKRARDVELYQQRRVAELTSAAEAVDREAYEPGSLHTLIETGDGIGRLARVFDRMVTGLRSREGRLKQQLQQLRTEIGDTANRLETVESSGESQFSSGEILAARYEILGRIGSGGMGMVYRARDLELGEDIAVKVLRRDIVKLDPVVVDRLKSEIRLARRISHNNVLRSHDLGEWNGTYFITMEYVQGLSVAELIDRRGVLSVESTIAIGRQLCEALAVAHEQGIVHRDIKPANLLVDAAGVLKVMDFGIARSLTADMKLTAGGFMVGTPPYMAPEVLMGRPSSPGTDVYAVGVVLYECLTGHVPFTAESPIELLAQVLEDKAPRVRTVAPDVPEQLDQLVHKQLQFEPSRRTNTARELAAQLAEVEPTKKVGEQ